MHNQDDLEALISGYLDGELSPEEEAQVEARLATDASFREEFENMKRLVTSTTGLIPPLPPDEVWDSFLDGVYNRAERQTGWLVFVVGIVALAAYGVYAFATTPGSAWIKLLVATPVVGISVLFLSVLRQRLAVAKSDRYSREIKR